MMRIVALAAVCLALTGLAACPDSADLASPKAVFREMPNLQISSATWDPNLSGTFLHVVVSNMGVATNAKIAALVYPFKGAC